MGRWLPLQLDEHPSDVQSARKAQFNTSGSVCLPPTLYDFLSALTTKKNEASEAASVMASTASNVGEKMSSGPNGDDESCT
jgi:hypothetical protein